MVTGSEISLTEQQHSDLSSIAQSRFRGGSELEYPRDLVLNHILGEGRAFQYVAMMEETIQHGSDGRAVTQEFSPVLYGSIGSEQSAGTLITPHYDFQ